MDDRWLPAKKALVTLCALPLAMAQGCRLIDAAETAEENMFVVRIAEIEVHREWIDAYLAAAGTVGAESVAKEPGVVCIFPMQKQESPTSIRIVEIYRDEEAYQTHLATPHFRAYKEETPHMIKSLKLVPMRPLDPEHADGIFRKWKTSGVTRAISGITDTVGASGPNMFSPEMKEEAFFEQPLAFQTNLLRLVACANAAYPGVEIPHGYRPFTDAEWRACGLDTFAATPYTGDGYLHYASGLRARLMASTESDGIVVAWSGCDFDNGSNGFTDASAVTRQYFGYLDSQYGQALKIMNGVLSSTTGHVEVVGHSLGGGLTTYVVAACNDKNGRVTGTTFNGLGLSRLLQARLSAAERSKAEASVINVKSSADPVFIMPMARHYGRIYDIPQESDAWKAHSIDILIGVMRKALDLVK